MTIKIGIATIALAALVSCASTPPKPTVAETRAATSVEQADQAGARRFDPGTLDTSKEKLAQARTAAEKGDAKVAERLNEQAELDAELAAATARSASAKKAADEVRASIEALRAETARQPAT